MRRELQAKPPASRRMTPKQARRHEPKEFPLAHDAATWDEDTFDTGWDDDEARLAGELAPDADD